ELAVTAAAGGDTDGGDTDGGDTDPAPGEGAAGDAGSSDGGDLATTGADSTALIVGAVLLLAMGLGLFALRRRMRAE
ncbi:LPXTG cell wall anchor domain-containing protein, partial [Microbacterium sp.]|uniref:LPXTG cell wall anchor domain-containing protein n=1 Tax=Microbacterium sp. TaxID=51671 RepID=UPI003F982611